MGRSGKSAITKLLLVVAAITLGLAVRTRVHAGSSAVPQVPASSPAAHPAAPASLSAGTVIDSRNANQFASYIPAAAMFAVGHGFRIKVVPTERIQWSAGFEQETEKYSAQVGLDKDGFITNYVAGLPFPLIAFSDPKAANKVANNWHLGPVLPDDYSLAPWGSNGYAADKSEPGTVRPSGLDDQCEEFDFLRFAHRSEVDPKPALGSNPESVEWKAKCTQWTQTSLGGRGEGAGIWVRYLDPRRSDDFFSFSEQSRRIRRSTVELEYPDQVCRQCHQPYWAYALPKTEAYTYRLLGTATILGCMNAEDEPAGIDASEGKLTTEPFELRNTYILEMTPTDKEHAGMRTLIFIDGEIYVWLAAEFYEGGQRVATAIPLWKMRQARGGGNVFDLAGSFYVPSSRPGFFRSLVPAHGSFEQKINTGALSERAFRPEALELQGR